MKHFMNATITFYFVYVAGPAVERAVPEPPCSDSESESEGEEGAGRGARNDGTLLASDPPKPL